MILESVAHSPDGLTLSEISRRLGAPISSVQQLVNGLVATGYVLENNRRYYIGPGVFTLTMGADWSTVAPVSHGLLTRLSEQLGVVVLLGVIVGDNLIYVDASGDDPRLEYYVYNRSRRPLVNTAGGKILLASLPDHRLQERLSELRAVYDVEDVDTFVTELHQIRRNGYATSAAVAESFAVGVGIPGRSPGSVPAALVAVGPREDTMKRVTELAERLRAAITESGEPSRG